MSANQVETVGQVYMVVAGAPERSKHHAGSIARVSQDMIKEFLKLKRSTQGYENVNIRIGLSSLFFNASLEKSRERCEPTS